MSTPLDPAGDTLEIPAEDVVAMLLHMGHEELVRHALTLCVNERLTARVRALEAELEERTP